MTTPLLRTKLYIPPVRPGLVPRPRLIQRLDEGLRLGHRLTLVSAPAGFGKTTLLSEWVARCGRPVVWLSLDEGDNAPKRFWAYVVAAFQTVLPRVGEATLAVLQLPQLPPAEAILTPLLNDLAAGPNDVILVLDDYHVISAEAIHEGIAFLLDHQSQGLHLGLSTRAAPPFSIVRLRARGQLTELRDAGLRFTAGETEAFLNNLMGLELSPEDVKALAARTEGWIVGLQLAALSMQGRSDVQEFVAAFAGSHHYILEYLTEEVLSRQSPPVQHFLTRTSILDRFCVPLGDAVTGRDDGDAMLAYLQQNNLFVVSLDNDRRWYRYHRLFADLLRDRLRQEVGAEDLAELHRRASAWHEANGSLGEAVEHALAAGDFKGVARLAEQAARASLLDSRLTTLLGWLETLPERVLHARPRLRIYRAWALFLNGQLDLAEQMLRDARQALQSWPSSPKDDALRDELTRLLDTMEAIAAGLTYGLYGNVEQAVRSSLRARALADKDGSVLLVALATEALALARYYQGRLRESAQTCRQVIELAERHAGTTEQALPLPLAAAGYVELAGISIEQNELGEAARCLDRAFALCRQGGGAKTLVEAHVAQSRLELALGDLKAAHEALRRAEQVYPFKAPYSVTGFRLVVQRARLNLAAGALSEVTGWIRELAARFAPERAKRALPVTYREVLQMMLARVRLAQGEAKAALVILEPLYGPAEDAGRWGQVVEVCLLKALALQAMDRTEAALKQLERSLEWAEPEGYVRPYLEGDGPARDLLAIFSRRASFPPHLRRYARKLLEAFDSGAGEEPETSGSCPALVEPLTRRELEVLRLMAAGLNAPEIAQELAVAPSTVRSHIKSFYRKLDAHSRYKAIERARALHLL